MIVTRARAQAGSLCQRIEALGGEVIEIPTIEIQPPDDYAPFDAAVERIASYDWLIFTSVNSVEPFVERLKRIGKGPGDVKPLKIAAIGAQTAKRLAAVEITVSLVPARYQAEGILDQLNESMVRGKRILIPRAAKARDLLPDTLRQWGASVDVVEAYRTVAPPADIAAVRTRLQHGDVDIITFTSSSTVSNFVQLFDGARLSSIVGNSAIACIGPITAQTVEDLGGRVAVMARPFTIDGLVQAIVDFVHSRETSSGEMCAVEK